MIDQGIRTILLAESTVTTLLSEATKGVYVGFADMRAKEPFVEVHWLTGQRLVGFDNSTGLRISSLDVDCKAKTQEGAEALVDAVETFLDDFTGAAGDATVRAVVQQNDRQYGDEQPEGNRKYPRSVYTLDFDVHWEPT